jgi:molecular chaperone GrpE
MGKNLDNNEEKQSTESDVQDNCCGGCDCDCQTQNGNEFDEIKAKLDDKGKQCEEYFHLLQRTAAEFDNYKKRTAREKEALYSEAASDVVAAILPVVDSLERAVSAADRAEDKQALKEGVELVFRQMKDVMKGLGVEEIKTAGEAFDPNLHNAVMHVEDEAFGENAIVEEFQKGYTLKGKVLRHSMVKVAN